MHVIAYVSFDLVAILIKICCLHSSDPSFLKFSSNWFIDIITRVKCIENNAVFNVGEKLNIFLFRILYSVDLGSLFIKQILVTNLC